MAKSKVIDIDGLQIQFWLEGGPGTGFGVYGDDGEPASPDTFLVAAPAIRPRQTRMLEYPATNGSIEEYSHDELVRLWGKERTL